jgi:hypothetical protein
VPPVEQLIGGNREIDELEAMFRDEPALFGGRSWILFNGADQGLGRVAELAEVEIVEFRVLFR